MKTKYGNAKINNEGYYRITSKKEGNYDKLLHRLIFEDYHNCKLDENDVIHHIDFDKTNNHPTNLICMSNKAHSLLHHPRGENHPNYGQTGYWANKKRQEHSERMNGKNNPMYGKSHPKNTSGYYRVSKYKNKECKQGFTYIYRYNENNKTKFISSISIDKLEQKVKAKGLEWRKIL